MENTLWDIGGSLIVEFIDVLILIIMENTLWVRTMHLISLMKGWVLILIIMENTLWAFKQRVLLFNTLKVLILIIMENTLWVKNEYVKFCWISSVLILIIMENTLWVEIINHIEKIEKSLNPYYNGKYSMSGDSIPELTLDALCLNPYYNGKYSMS